MLIQMYCRGQPHVSNICWNKKPDPEAKLCSRGDGLVFMMFSRYADVELYEMCILHDFCRGPCAALRVIIGGGLGAGDIGLGPDRLVCMYLSSGLVDCAINLLSCLNWENQGQACLASLCQIVNHLLSKRLTPAIEGR
jgi:WD repeat-containing and planar cell polarity effector protein Fritz